MLLVLSQVRLRIPWSFTRISTLPFCITPTHLETSQPFVQIFRSSHRCGVAIHRARVVCCDKTAIGRSGSKLTSMWCRDPRKVRLAMRRQGPGSTMSLTIPITVPYSATSSAFTCWTKPAENRRPKRPIMLRPKAQLRDRGSISRVDL